ncbi:hypothetical protein AB0J01_27885 [Streptomyces sp. NPDC050204]|uniref:helix-turn-helix transcriptional regulator n=1 Tax=Streptomyces sp. NPDC050204 TaxID=3155514 RepID=UPI00343FED4B
MAEEDTSAPQKLTDEQVAEWFGVAVSAANKWRVGQVQSAQPDKLKTPPFSRTAKAMGLRIGAKDKTNGVVPREIVEAFGKAVGYLNEEGELIRETRKGRWTPSAPTIDPVPDKNGQPRMRWYVPQVAERYGVPVGRVNVWRVRGKLPGAHKDELSRVFWYVSDLDEWDAKAEAGPEPDGFDGEGRPFQYLSKVTDRADGVDSKTGRAYKLLPADNYYAKKAAAK